MQMLINESESRLQVREATAEEEMILLKELQGWVSAVEWQTQLKAAAARQEEKRKPIDKQFERAKLKGNERAQQQKPLRFEQKDTRSQQCFWQILFGNVHQFFSPV